MIALFRHGQTDWSKKERTQGQLDIPLNRIGRQQARALSDWFRNQYGDNVDALFTSGLSRTIQTGLLAFPTKQVVEDARLNEQDFGDQQGTEREAWLSENPSFREQEVAADDPYNLKWPNGESTHDVRDRVFAALDEITEVASDKTVVVISHATPLMCAQAYFTDTELGDADVVSPCEGFIIEHGTMTSVKPLEATMGTSD